MPTNLFATRISNLQLSIGVSQTGVFDAATCNELLKRGNKTANTTDLKTLIKMVQRMVNADDDGVAGPQTVTRVEAFINPVLPKTPTGSSLVVSVKSIDMIVFFEVSSKEFYNKFLQRPIWPGEESGITIGVGCDLGHTSEEKIKAAWGPNISAADLNLLLSVRGLKGLKAKNKLSQVNSVKIPFDVAYKVFFESTLPDHARETKRAYAGVDKLPPDAQGSLLSLVFNRGGSTNKTKDSRIEMFNIIELVKSGDLQGIAKQIRKMKRLWPDSKGLRDRRDKEADRIENASFNILPEDQVVV
jgi:hypothetical protein